MSAREHQLLESAYRDWHTRHLLATDPIALVHSFDGRHDREAAGLVASLLAYGNVKTILASVTKVLALLGPSPHAGIIDLKFAGKLSPFRHRFTTGRDMEVILTWIAGALRSHGTLESFFSDNADRHDAEMKGLLGDFVRRLAAQPLPPELAAHARRRERSIKYLLSDPERGSACKRLNMYLRWMVREEDGIDFGLWKAIKAAQLVLPIDTHLLQTIRALRWTRSRQATWKVAESATRRLRLYSPDDPVRYDFALCHLSMAGDQIKRYAQVARAQKVE